MVLIFSYNYNFSNSPREILHPQNRAFRYGDAVFESIRVVEGKICFFNDHFNRLTEGLRFLEIDIRNLNKEHLLAHLYDLLNKNNIEKGAKLRLQFWRCEGGLYTPTNNHYNFIAEVEPYASNFFSYRNEGMLVDIYSDLLKPQNTLSNIKSANGLIYIKAGLFKNRNKLEECFLLNQSGYLAEGVAHNVFLVFENKILTPALHQGCLNGIMRQQIIKIATYLGVQVQETIIKPEAILQADEVFFTNAIQGINWVRAYRNKRYFNKTSKLLNETLNKLLISTLLDLQE